MSSLWNIRNKYLWNSPNRRKNSMQKVKKSIEYIYGNHYKAGEASEKSGHIIISINSNNID